MPQDYCDEMADVNYTESQPGFHQQDDHPFHDQEEDRECLPDGPDCDQLSDGNSSYPEPDVKTESYYLYTSTSPVQQPRVHPLIPRLSLTAPRGYKLVDTKTYSPTDDDLPSPKQLMRKRLHAKYLLEPCQECDSPLLVSGGGGGQR